MCTIEKGQTIDGLTIEDYKSIEGEKNIRVVVTKKEG
jgi:hypothetical protein